MSGAQLTGERRRAARANSLMSERAFLILDDSASERTIIQHVLSEAFPNAAIYQASDAETARGIIATLELDCILLDYSMPRMDGVSFAEELRPAHPHLPIVLVTGVGDEMLVSHALRRGVTDYIPKSRINVESMRRIAERAIQSCSLSKIVVAQREELETFAYALAHDFKQPIRQIRTFSELISQEMPNGDSVTLQKYLTFLGQAAHRLSSLVDVMSQYTLLNQEPKLAPVSLATVIKNVREALAAEIEERHAEVTFQGDCVLHGNETLLGQVLQNLVVNGIKYNKSDVPCVEIRATCLDGECTITIRDNGIGIEQKYLSEIFRPLVRLHTTAAYAGTGLGLTLARKAILAQRGAITCESDVGVGSTFSVRMAMEAAKPGTSHIQQGKNIGDLIET